MVTFLEICLNIILSKVRVTLTVTLHGRVDAPTTVSTLKRQRPIVDGENNATSVAQHNRLIVMTPLHGLFFTPILNFNNE